MGSIGGDWMISIGKYVSNFINPYDPGSQYASKFPRPPSSFGQQIVASQLLPRVLVLSGSAAVERGCGSGGLI